MNKCVAAYVVVSQSGNGGVVWRQLSPEERRLRIVEIRQKNPMSIRTNHRASGHRSSIPCSNVVRARMRQMIRSPAGHAKAAGCGSVRKVVVAAWRLRCSQR